MTGSIVDDFRNTFWLTKLKKWLEQNGFAEVWFSWTILILDLALSYTAIVGIPMVTNCAPLEDDLFLFCYERDVMKYLSNDNQADIIKVFNSILILKEWSTKFIHLNCN